MPNALNAKSSSHRILMLGDAGSGKTTQFLTLPGKKYMYMFDPSGILSLRGHDVDYDEYLPDRLNLAASSLSKGKGDKGSVVSSDIYLNWEREFNERLSNGFFDSYDWVGIDSATTFLDLIMDRILTINSRFGQWPNQDDYGPQMVTFTNVCRALTSLGKQIYMTGHLDIRQEDLSKKIYRRPMMTGRLATKIPLLFSDIFITEAETVKITEGTNTKEQVMYQLQTVPDKITTCVRNSIKGLEPYENVTIDWSKPVIGQGLGGILNWERKQLQPNLTPVK